MMSEKVKRFGDRVTRRDNIASSDLAQQKRLERSVSNFNQGLWERHRYDVVCKGNLAKFSIPPFRRQLVDTGDKFLAEASPHDLVWGIGFKAADWQALRPPQWRGLNLLGDILMAIRRQLDRPLPPCRSTRVSPSDNGIHETSATMAPPTGASVLDQLLHPFLAEKPPACALVSPLHPDLTPLTPYRPLYRTWTWPLERLCHHR